MDGTKAMGYTNMPTYAYYILIVLGAVALVAAIYFGRRFLVNRANRRRGNLQDLEGKPLAPTYH